MESIEFSESIIQKYTDEFINSTVEEIRKGIDIRDRKYHFKKYTMWFVGSDLVNWLIKNGNEKDNFLIKFYFLQLSQRNFKTYVNLFNLKKYIKNL